MIVFGGENVHADEVENLLAGLEGVREVAVVGVADADLGQRLAAFLVLEHGAAVGAEDVRAYVKDNLARFAVPRDVVFLDELPRTSTGKVLERTLRSRCPSRRPPPRTRSVADAGRAPPGWSAVEPAAGAGGRRTDGMTDRVARAGGPPGAAERLNSHPVRVRAAPRATDASLGSMPDPHRIAPALAATRSPTAGDTT